MRFVDIDEKTFNIDPEKYTGWAFGLGIERMVMRKHSVPDIESGHDLMSEIKTGKGNVADLKATVEEEAAKRFQPVFVRRAVCCMYDLLLREVQVYKNMVTSEAQSMTRADVVFQVQTILAISK